MQSDWQQIKRNKSKQVKKLNLAKKEKKEENRKRREKIEKNFEKK